MKPLAFTKFLLALTFAFFALGQHQVVQAAADNRASAASQGFTASLPRSSAAQPNSIRLIGETVLPIVQQPANDPGFVSSEADVVTRFAMADLFGNVGIIAHNHLAGNYFFDLKIGQLIEVVQGDGSIEYYRVKMMEEYQALSPNSPSSDFLDENGNLISAHNLFLHVYGSGTGNLILQTCIMANGDPSWGRLFITAEPVTDKVRSVLSQAGGLVTAASLGMAH